MSYPYPAIDENGIVREVQTGFVRALRRSLAGPALFAGKETRTGHWGIEELKWREITDLSGATISMDIPPVNADSGTIKAKSVEIPIFTKDVSFNGRKWRQAREMGLDPVIFNAQARAMAEEISKYLLFGRTGGPGATTSILNHADMPTAIAGGDWTDPTAINEDLGSAIQALLLARQPGPYTVLMNPGDSGVFNQFLNTQTGIRIGQNLPSMVGRIIYDEDIGALDAYLVADSNDLGNYDVVAPRNEDGMSFGLGAITAGLLTQGPGGSGGQAGGIMEQVDEFMKTRVVRMLNILTPRVIRGNGAIKIDFTKS